MQRFARSTICSSTLTARRSLHNARIVTGYTRYPLVSSASLSERNPRLRTIVKAAHLRSAHLSTSTSTATGRSGMSTHKEIVAKLVENFGKARESGDLLFFPSTVHTHAENGVEVRLPAFAPTAHY